MSSKKPNPKRAIILFHKLAALSALTVETLDELHPDTKEFKDFRENISKTQEMCHEILDNVYKVEEIYQGTYLNDLSTKVDTVIRRNFETVPQT